MVFYFSYGLWTGQVVVVVVVEGAVRLSDVPPLSLPPPPDSSSIHPAEVPLSKTLKPYQLHGCC